MGRKSNAIKLVEERIAEAEARLKTLYFDISRANVERELVMGNLERDRELLRVISETPETKKEAAKDGGQSVETA